VQDTFFLSRPKELPVQDKSLVRRIKAEHEKAWHGEWSEKFASRAILRTHTTSVTGRYINSTINAMIGKKRGFEPPIKFFSVGRVFRNENLDYKHLADFYMHDGIIIGKNLTLAHLFDVLTKLYKSVGVKIRFKPAYFPFVEPGVEVHVLQNGEWLEMGGAGIIRKEVTGVERKTISVLAWGLPIERIALLRKSGVESIVELYNSGAGPLRRMKV
jgi:phenylalanyl-tRNA synthetase alpha chain